MIIKDEIAAGRLLISSMHNVIEFALIGSAMMELPEVHDIDFAVLLAPGQDAIEYSMALHEAGWGVCGDYDATGGTWTAIRRGLLNLMITHDPKFFAGYKTAMEVCKALNLQHKEDRIAVCQIVRDGKKATEVITYAQLYGPSPFTHM